MRSCFFRYIFFLAYMLGFTLAVPIVELVAADTLDIEPTPSASNITTRGDGDSSQIWWSINFCSNSECSAAQKFPGGPYPQGEYMVAVEYQGVVDYILGVVTGTNYCSFTGAERGSYSYRIDSEHDKVVVNPGDRLGWGTCMVS